MSTRQYIGARYVPIFADPIEWDKNKSYENLTIVVYNGNSYTSKIPVPKNVDISNEKYWAMTGNYNAQLEAYRKELEKNIDITKRKFLVIGDSYNNQSLNPYAPNGVTVWGIQAMGILGVIDFKNVGLNGAGWYRVNSDGKTFIDAIREEDNNEAYTDIIVCGGINDIVNSESDSSVRSPMPEIGEFIALAKQKFGYNVRIHIGVVGYAHRKKQVLQYYYANYVQNNEEGYNFEYINNIQYSIRGTQYLISDKIHPNQKGSTRIANFIVQHILGGGCNANYNFGVTSTGGKFNVSTFVTIHNGVATIKTSENVVKPTDLVYTPSNNVMGNIDCGVLTNYPFVGSTTISALRFMLGSGITCIVQDKSSAALFSAYGTLRLEPMSSYDDNGVVTETKMMCTLSLYDSRTNTALASGHTIKEIRLPSMNVTSHTLAM